jgi:hypothetical protein
MPRRCSLLQLYLGGFLSAVCANTTLAQHTVSKDRLYLLSATTTEHTDKTFPAELYRVSANKKLKSVRELVSRTDGVRLVEAWGNAIFLLHPHVVSTAVAVVHTDAPEQADDVVFNPSGLVPVTPWVAVAARTPADFDLLIPLSSTEARQEKPTLVCISSAATETAQRVRLGAWNEYAAVRREGSQGGPAIVPYLVASITSDKLAVTVFSHSAAIDRTPPLMRGGTLKSAPAIVAASKEWLVLDVQYQQETSESLPHYTEMSVKDRVLGQWKTVQIEGNASRSRLFGSWLATIIGMRNPDHKTSPGRENERSQETDRLPNVQTEYAIFAAKWTWFPGILTLQNLTDGRKIRIETGQEDSEILKVKDDLVLYRVNDAIYQARIDGSQLKDTTVIVKDEDVPEIHWAFWSK